eukprot:1129332-Pyramimonas_sp.AAC.1
MDSDSCKCTSQWYVPSPYDPQVLANSEDDEVQGSHKGTYEDHRGNDAKRRGRRGIGGETKSNR